MRVTTTAPDGFTLTNGRLSIIPRISLFPASTAAILAHSGINPGGSPEFRSLLTRPPIPTRTAIILFLL